MPQVKSFSSNPLFKAWNAHIEKNQKIADIKQAITSSFPGVDRNQSSIGKMVNMIESKHYQQAGYRCDQGYRVPKSKSGFPFTLEIFTKPDASHDEVYLCAGGKRTSKIGEGADKIVSLGLNYHTYELVSVYKTVDPKDQNRNQGLIKDVEANKLLAPLIREDPSKYKFRVYQSRNHKAGGDFRSKAIVPYYPQGDLAEHLEGQQLSKPECVWMALDLARQVRQLHDLNIVHSDIKPENIMKTDKGHYALMDFGLATEADKFNNIQGTPIYLDPSLLTNLSRGILGTKEGPKVDIYNLGLVMKDGYFGITKKVTEDGRIAEVRNTGPVQDYVEKCLEDEKARSYQHLAKSINKRHDQQRQEFEGDHGSMQPYIDLMTKMISPNPLSRPTIREVVRSLEQLQYDQTSQNRPNLPSIRV